MKDYFKKIVVEVGWLCGKINLIGPSRGSLLFLMSIIWFLFYIIR